MGRAEDMLAARRPSQILSGSRKFTVGSKENTLVSTNLYCLSSQKIPVYRYNVTIRVSIKIRDGSLKWIYFTKKSSKESVIIDRHEYSRNVFLAFCKHYEEFIKDPKCVYYDLQSILYSLDPLQIPKDEEITFDIPVEEIDCNLVNINTCELTISCVKNDFELNLADLNFDSQNLMKNENLVQFFEIATSQKLLFEPNNYIANSSKEAFLVDPVQHGFKENDFDIFDKNGSYLTVGIKKNIRFIEGHQKNYDIGLVVEAKKTAFHIVETLLEKAKRLVRNIQNVQREEILQLNVALIGLAVETNHLKHVQKFFVRGVDIDSAKSKKVLVNEKNISVQQYFKNKYQIDLKEPLAPLIQARGLNNTVCYVPMELCTIAANQRVKTNRLSTRQNQEILKKCIVSPIVSRENNQNCFKSLNLTSNNQYISNAGIEVVQKPVELNGRVLAPPTLEYAEGGRGLVRIQSDSFTWNFRQFLLPGKCKNWGAFALLGRRDRLDDQTFVNFIKRFHSDANNKGIKLAGPKIVSCVDQKNLKNVMEEAANQNLQFVFVVHSDFSDDIHENLKVYERQYEIITQALCYSTLLKLIQKNQPKTMTNILCKTNIKLGGLNYSIFTDTPEANEILKSNTLFIGISLQDAFSNNNKIYENKGKVSCPTIIGYAANYGLNNKFEFYGDYLCQEPSEENSFTVIGEIVKRCVEKFRNNQQVNPKRIVIYRNNCSESKFGQILQYEVSLIKSSLKEVDCFIPLNVIVYNKVQSIRFFKKNMSYHDQAVDQNVASGFVVDHTIVHPQFLEFFLNSQKVFQGTSKTPKYTILLNESNYNVQQYEAMTYVLCYGNQIVQIPISMPAPIYIAKLYSKRGRMLYKNWSNEDLSKLDYKEMSDTIGYINTRFENCRINA